MAGKPVKLFLTGFGIDL